jgi:hypothetical protein
MDDLSKAFNGAFSRAFAQRWLVSRVRVRKKGAQVAAPSSLELSKPEMDTFIRLATWYPGETPA